MRGLGILAAGAAVLALTLSGSVVAETVTVGNPPIIPDFAVAPKALPKRTAAPVTLVYEARLPTSTLSGDPAPAARRITLLLDRNIVLDLKRFPSCRADLEHNDTDSIRALCRRAIVGEGKVDFEFAAVSARPVAPMSETVVVNGGRRGDVRTLYVATFVTDPIVANAVFPIKIRRVDDGRYGLEATISIPASATETVGRLSSLALMLGRRYTSSRRDNALRAKCPDGKLLLASTIQFADGTRAESLRAKPCTPDRSTAGPGSG